MENINASTKKKEEKMRTIHKFLSVVTGALIVTALPVSTALAALNQATNSGSSVPLNPSGTVEVTSSQLVLVKVVFNTSGTCLASSDGDGACNGGLATVNVPVGAEVVFVIYVSNPTGITASDIRFQDAIRDVTTGSDYFAFQTNEFAAGQGIMWATRAATGATKANIWTALSSGTALTNAVDGDTGTNEYCGIDTTVSPDLLTCGGTGAVGSNDQVNIANDQLFAVKFHVTKQP
jgi:hypothetical protein